MALALPAIPATADVTVSTHATAHMSCSAGLCTPTRAVAVLNAGDLQTMLSSGDLTVKSSSAAPDIRIAAGLSLSGTHTLTLDAYRSIKVEKPVSVTSGGGLSIVTNDGGSGGVFAVAKFGSVQFLSLSSALHVNGAAYTLVGAVSTLASGIASNPSGNFALAASYNAGPDGIYSLAPVVTAFHGKFEGLGNTISNLSIRRANRHIGLFATLDTGGSAENIVISAMHLHATGNERSVGGALAAVNNGTVFNVHVSGKIGTQGTGGVGGALVGINNGTIAASSADARPQNGTACLGGLVGANTGTILQSYAKGNAGAAQTGGIACDNSGTITDTYELVKVSGRYTTPYPGGLVSVNEASGVISNSYAAGQITAAANFGGIAGTNNGSLSQVYWDTDNTGADSSHGCGAGSCLGATPLTELQLKSALPAGFDPAIWGQAGGINNGYPYLLNNPPR
jgi:hypothetical protein